MRPSVILADEPTGELDSVNAEAIFGLFQEMVQTEEMSIVATTHDQTLRDMADVVYRMHNGSIEQAWSSGEMLDSEDPHAIFRPPAREEVPAP